MSRLVKTFYPLSKKNAYQSDDWWTPDALFAVYDQLYGPFYMDVCATKQNTKVRRYIRRETDALTTPWTATCWMNPPYSGLAPWVRKARLESERGCTVVALLPVWTADSWFHDDVAPYADITLLRGRIHFNGPRASKFSATFPVMICVWPRSAAKRSATASALTVHLDQHAMRD